MKKYLVSLSRDYLVVVSAENEDIAKKTAEFYIGGEQDLSSKNDRDREVFNIDSIEMTMNESIDVEEYNYET